MTDFALFNRVGNETSFMQAVEHLPVEAFPSPVLVMQGQVEQREDSIVDGSGVDVHGIHSAALLIRMKNRSRLARISSAGLHQTMGLGFAL